MNFVIAGAQKAGTTALATFLGEHPEICIADKKEVHLFDDQDYSREWTPEAIDRRYAEACGNYSGQPLVGEATPIYLYWPHIAGELHRYNPEMRLIVLLRDPVERAISHHRMERARGNERLSLLPALLIESYRLRRDRGNHALDSAWRRHSYQDRGFYARQLQNLFRVFARDRVLVLNADALMNDHATTLRRVYAFLGVTDRSFMPQPATVFAGDHDRRRHRLARALLRARFSGEDAKLRQVFPDGDIR